MRLVALMMVAAGAWAAVQTGPEAGKAVPAFSLPDQDGRIRSFSSLKGKKGLVLAFVRSADW